MTYWLQLYTPDTWSKFLAGRCCITGFSERYRAFAAHIKLEDRFVCYVARLTVVAAVVTVKSTAFRDHSPLFGVGLDEIYTVRFRVAPLVLLGDEDAIGIKDLWAKLERTRGSKYGERNWAYKARLVTSLSAMSRNDGDTITDALTAKSSVRLAEEATIPT
jgi:hypothetical protein